MMITDAQPPVPAHAWTPAGLLRELFRRDGWLATVAAINLALFAIMAVAALVDTRTILGISPWIKPMKFALSIAIFTATIAWLLEHVTHPRIRWATSRGISVVMLVEIAAIAGQSARGQASHFNVATPFDAAVFNIMGIAIMANTALIAMLFAWFSRARPLPPAYLWGIRLGLLTLLLGSIEGFVMIGRGAHAVGVPDGGAGLPFVNWSTEGGDLRVAHFLALHGLQILPLIGYALYRRRPDLPAARQRAAMLAGFAAYAGVTVLLFWQALAGRPLWG